MPLIWPRVFVTVVVVLFVRVVATELLTAFAKEREAVAVNTKSIGQSTPALCEMVTPPVVVVVVSCEVVSDVPVVKPAEPLMEQVPPGAPPGHG